MDISKAELEVLQVIWHQHPCSASDIVQRLDNKDWHEKTIKSLLSRLVKKGAVSFEKDQRRYLYFPLIDKAEYQQSESKNLMERLFGGKLSPLVASFASQQKLQKDDVEALKKLIKDWENEGD